MFTTPVKEKKGSDSFDTPQLTPQNSTPVKSKRKSPVKPICSSSPASPEYVGINDETLGRYSMTESPYRMNCVTVTEANSQKVTTTKCSPKKVPRPPKRAQKKTETALPSPSGKKTKAAASTQQQQASVRRVPQRKVTEATLHAHAYVALQKAK